MLAWAPCATIFPFRMLRSLRTTITCLNRLIDAFECTAVPWPRPRYDVLNYMSRLLALVLLPLAFGQDPKPSTAEIRAIAERAYVYAYPLVLMAATRDTALVRSPPNAFLHAPQFPDSRFRQVIRPNADTLYSSAWIDLSQEPLILRVPDTHDRYYLLQFMDAWTETFAIPGKRTTGTGEGLFAIVGPGWKGTLPARAQRIESPTNMVWLLGRTQTNGVADYPNVHEIQKGFVLMPLSLYPDGPRARQPYTPAVPSRPEHRRRRSARWNRWNSSGPSQTCLR